MLLAADTLPIDPGSGGIIGGVLLIVGYSMWRMLKLVLDSNRDMEERHEKFLGNHMSSTVKTLENLTSATEGMRSEIRSVATRIEIENARNRSIASALERVVAAHGGRLDVEESRNTDIEDYARESRRRQQEGDRGA
jgi:hypothetical protein